MATSQKLGSTMYRPETPEDVYDIRDQFYDSREIRPKPPALGETTHRAFFPPWPLEERPAYDAPAAAKQPFKGVSEYTAQYPAKAAGAKPMPGGAPDLEKATPIDGASTYARAYVTPPLESKEAFVPAEVEPPAAVPPPEPFQLRMAAPPPFTVKPDQGPAPAPFDAGSHYNQVFVPYPLPAKLPQAPAPYKATPFAGESTYTASYTGPQPEVSATFKLPVPRHDISVQIVFGRNSGNTHVMTVPDVTRVLIPRLVQPPASGSANLVALRDVQNDATIIVLHGPFPNAAMNDVIGTFPLKFDTNDPRKHAELVVEAHLATDGQLTVTAKDVSPPA
eukprot:CAMPEP_0183809020 /NCGR_PEP_ID=MMETSP0803_2-20130417/44731_1 /TAXON_ID=195967 /ORGANISM="Crustomastix stigmata, Strain CCMP3273" /LENGTH=334 /DNA_ID=CAMNT_0026053835 /DNA_START=1 /DNA_END=1001 /DNA_ORIENTATION=+